MANKTIYFVLAVLISLVGINCFSISKVEPTVVVNLESLEENAECTEKMAAECALLIERTVKSCGTAFETEGADVIADIKCAKDLMADKKHCWPCICAEAEKRGWKVVGC